MSVSDDEARLLDLRQLSNKQAVDAFELVWHAKYDALSDIMRKLKHLRLSSIGIATGDSVSANLVPTNQEDYSATFALLSSSIDAVFNYMQQLIGRLAAQFEAEKLDSKTEKKLEAIYARYCVVCGDLYRYLDKHRTPQLGPSEQYKKAVERYTEAIRVNSSDGRAYSGLYIVTASASRTLLSVVYLVKSLVAEMPFNQDADVLPSVAKRICASPSQLKDVPIPARRCTAAAVDLVCVHLTGHGRDRVDPLVKAFAATIPSKDVPELKAASSPLVEIPWDAQLAILLISALSFGKNTSTHQKLLQVLKVLMTFSLSFKRAVAVAAALTSDVAKEFLLPQIKREALNSFSKVSKSDCSQRYLPMDHLLGLNFADRGSSATDQEIAASRICVSCNVTIGGIPVSLALTRDSGTKPTVIVDAANVACRTGELSRVADIQGVRSVVDYWKKRGHVVKVFASEKHARRNSRASLGRRSSTTRGGMEINLDGIFDVLANSEIVLIPPQNHDDSYMIEYALRVDGIIVSNDMFRDWSSRHVRAHEAAKWAETHVVPFTMVDHIYIPNPDFKIPPHCKTETLMR